MLLITFEKETIPGAINEETSRRTTGENGEQMQLNDKDYERLTLSDNHFFFFISISSFYPFNKITLLDNIPPKRRNLCCSQSSEQMGKQSSDEDIDSRVKT